MIKGGERDKINVHVHVPSKGQVEVFIKFSPVYPLTDSRLTILSALRPVEVIHFTEGKLRREVATIRVISSRVVTGIHRETADVLPDAFKILC